uniref:Uncharacterized protein n=1 Tax=Heterorhabditis bacteriophora TaxID=37862 RepID=A0A1I7WH77_HETBA
MVVDTIVYLNNTSADTEKKPMFYILKTCASKLESFFVSSTGDAVVT